MDCSSRAALRGRLGLSNRIARVAAPALVILLAVPALVVRAQGVSTGSITGTVRSVRGDNIDDARVEVLNRASGHSVTTSARGGRFFAFGLEVGGPYVVTVRRLGFTPASRDSIYLSLGAARLIELVLEPTAQTLDGIHIVEGSNTALSSQAGTSTTISDSLLHRLPSLNRDMYDFVRLVPQVASRFGGLSAGVNNRLNSYLIDGVSDRQLGGNQVMGGPRGGKSMPINAIKEYQVLLTPYDARYGDFAGLLVNAVTKSGTNELHGSAFGFLRNERLARPSGFLGGSAYERQQFGFTLGGPIVRNRVHFFIAPEFQHHEEPATGPYIGQRGDSPVAVPASAGDIERFGSLLGAHGMYGGNGGRVTIGNPVAAFFGRLDLSLPEWRSRLAVRHTYSSVKRTQFARAATSRFSLSSQAWSLKTTKLSSALQLFTQPAARAFNEFLVAYSEVPNGAAEYTYAPTVQVSVPNATGPGTATLIAGPPDAGQGAWIINRSVEIADNFNYQITERHGLTVGARAELLRYYGPTGPGMYGRWTFSSLDSLERGLAASYRVSSDFGAATIPLNGVQFGAYLNNEWHVRRGLTISGGLRTDVLSFDAQPGYNAAIESVFGRRTSDFPGTAVHWSPRLGVSWEPGGRTRLRGGAGLFAGRPPLGWLRSPLRQYGTGIRTLTCTGLPVGPKIVPEFSANPGSKPNACANGKPYSSGAVDLVDRGLRMGEALRASLAVDRDLPWDVVATAEAMYTRNTSDFMLVNLNLRGPQHIDRHGRVMYGTLGPTGARPVALVDTVPEVIDLRNHSRNYSWSLTGQMTKRFSSGVEARAAYTYTVMRDVQSITGNPGGNPVIDLWAGARQTAGRHEDLTPGISSFDLPHRVVLAATYAAPWKRWATDFSVYYIGESGLRFTYLDSSATPGFGDLNADGSNANDPIYVPRNAADTAEILFDPRGDVARQQSAFEAFIRGSSCLRGQRGKIVERNSCLAPWVHSAHVSVRQAFPPVSGHRLSVQLDIFNVLNLMNSQWGLMRLPNINVLEHVAQTPGAPNVSRSVFRFDPALQHDNSANAESSYQLQVAMRYRF